MLLDDPVQCRLHWPLNTDLHINLMPFRVYSRVNNVKLGAGGRDEPANVGLLCTAGRPTLVKLVGYLQGQCHLQAGQFDMQPSNLAARHQWLGGS